MSSNERDGDPEDKPPTKSKLEDSTAHGGLSKYLREREVKISDTEKQCVEYAAKLSNIKARSSVRSPKPETPGDKSRGADSAAKEVRSQKGDKQSPGSKSLMLLRQKTNENRAMFEQRGREISENKKGLEMRLEQLQVQLNERDSTIRELLEARPAAPSSRSHTPIPQHAPLALAPQQCEDLSVREQELSDLRARVFELESVVIGLQENLLEKDSVIDARTKAIALMSEDLCRKGKSTLDQLEETKEEMRLMQCNFVAHEANMKTEKELLNLQLAEKDIRLSELEATRTQLETELSDLSTRLEATGVGSDLEQVNMDLTLDSSEVTVAHARIEELGNTIAELEEEKGNLQLHLVDFDDIKELCERQQSEHRVTEQNLEECIQQLQRRLSDMEELKVKAELKAVQLEEDVDNLTSQLSREMQQIKHEEHADMKLFGMSEEANFTVDQLNDELINKISRIDSMEAQLSSVLGVGLFEEWIEQIVQFKSKISALENTVMQFDNNFSSLDSLKEELESSITEVAEKTQIINNLLDHLSKCEAELEHRDQELQKATSSQSQQKEKMKKLIANIKVRNAEIKDHKERVKHMESIIEQRDSVIAKFESNVEEVERTKEDEKQKLEEENTCQKQLLQEVQLQAEDCREELNQTLANLVQEESYRCQLEKEFSAFKAKHNKEMHMAKNNITVLENKLSTAEERLALLIEELKKKDEHIRTLVADIQEAKVLSDSSLAELTSVISNLQCSGNNKERDYEAEITQLKAEIEHLGSSYASAQDVAARHLARTEGMYVSSNEAFLSAEETVRKQCADLENAASDLLKARERVQHLEQALYERDEMLRAGEASRNEILSSNNNHMQAVEYYKNQLAQQATEMEKQSAEFKIVLDRTERNEVLRSGEERQQTATLQALEAEIHSSRDKIHQLEQSVSERDDMLRASEARQEEQAAEISRCNESYRQAMEYASNRIDEQVTEMEAREAQLKNAMDEAYRLQQISSEHDEMLRDNYAKLNEQASFIETLRAELETDQDKIRQLETSLNDRDVILKERIGELETLRLQLADKQAAISELEELGIRLQTEKEANGEYRTLVSDLQTQITQLLNSNEHHIEEVDRLKNELKSSAAVYEQNYNQVTDKLQKSVDNLKVLHSDFELNEKKSQLQVEKAEKLLEEKRSVEADLEEATNRLISYVSKTEELETEFANVKDKLNKSEEFASAFAVQEGYINSTINNTLKLLTQYSSEIETQLAAKEEAVIDSVRQLHDEHHTRLELESAMLSLKSEYECKVSALEHDNNHLLEELNALRVSLPLLADAHGTERADVVSSRSGLQSQEGHAAGDPRDTWIETEEGWGWGSEEARLEEQHQITQQQQQPTLHADSHLQQQFVELEQKVEELELEKEKLSGELRAAQVRSGKLLKQLKDLKAKDSKATKPVGLTSLDQEMEKEFTNRISTLENEVLTLKDLKESLTMENQRLKNHIDSLEWQISELKDDKAKLTEMLVESRKTQWQDNSYSFAETKEVQEKVAYGAECMEETVGHSYTSNQRSISGVLDDDMPSGEKLVAGSVLELELENARTFCEELKSKLVERESRVSDLDNALSVQLSETERLSEALELNQSELNRLCDMHEKLTCVHQNTQAALESVQCALQNAELNRKDEEHLSLGQQMLPPQNQGLEVITEQMRHLNDTLKLRENEVELMKKYQVEMELDYSARLEKNLADIEMLQSSVLLKDEQIAVQCQELNNLKVELSRHTSEIKQLRDLSIIESKRVLELEDDLLAQDKEAEAYRTRLEYMTKEIKEQKTVIELLKSVQSSSQAVREGETRADELEQNAQELDTALYLLHQKDVRCDEMTLELVQLLEERDTLQLRLSTCLRENMEMSRSAASVSSSPVGSSPASSSPVVMHPEGSAPVAAFPLPTTPPRGSPHSEPTTPSRTKILEDKLDQVRNVSREQRQRALQQQRSGDTVDANFTVSRDVQSQPETFMNWLWGRSTPRVTDV